MLSIWRKFIHHFTYSNLLIALCAGSICELGFLLFPPAKNQHVLILFIISSTQFSYLFHRIIDHLYDGNPMLNDQDIWLNSNQQLAKSLLILDFCLSFWALSQIGTVIWPLLFFVCLCSLWYILRFQPLKSMQNLRKVPYLKPFIIAINWSIFTAIIPIIAGNENGLIEPKHLWFAIAIALFVFGQAIPFDLRDMLIDKSKGLKTLAHKFGFKGIKLLSTFSYFLVLIALMQINDMPKQFALSIGIALILSLLIIIQLSKKHAQWKYSMLLESSLSFPFLTYYFGRLLFL